MQRINKMIQKKKKRICEVQGKKYKTLSKFKFNQFIVVVVVVSGEW